MALLCGFLSANVSPALAQETRRSEIAAHLTVTADGRTENLVAVSGVPCGLTEQATAAVKTRRLKPRFGPDGKPVAVTTPIEIVSGVN